MDEDERLKQGITPPDTHAWNSQMHRVRVFSQLIYDTDRNLQNVLIAGDWKIWIIDFTRAFRTVSKLPEVEDLVKCEKGIYVRLQELSRDAVSRSVGAHFNKMGGRSLDGPPGPDREAFSKAHRGQGRIKGIVLGLPKAYLSGIP